MTLKKILLFSLLFAFGSPIYSQGIWHDTIRNIQYTPEGKDIVCINGKNKFTRALYGTNTKYRIETSDMPEIGIFAPDMGGNLQLGIILGNESLWLNNAETIKSIYRAGSRIYEISDPILKNGKLIISVLAMADAEGMVLQIESKEIPKETEIICMFGGASNQRFYRNGDLGMAGPNIFALKADNCINNQYSIKNNQFTLEYGKGTKSIRNAIGTFPEDAKLKIASPYKISSPVEAWSSESPEDKPIILSRFDLNLNELQYLAIQNVDKKKVPNKTLEQKFNEAEAKRKLLAEAITINTPDEYINPVGQMIGIASDGVWENSWLHGAIGWRMPLTGWRAAYQGDCLGKHELTRSHFDGFAASQIRHIEPTIPHPAQDTALNFARAAKIWGTQMYSNGYICRNPYDTTRMHHYDMNQMYIDELLWHFNWTGDMEYVEKMWPVLKSSLAWEKRNYDPNDDGLYDAYASIWASDALYYNSGGVTHPSAINYRANKMAAEIAKKIGKDPKPYQQEADKILKAINETLWMENKGVWAEFKDYMGNQLLHPHPAIWTIYHAIDSDIETPFQAYQATRYVDTEIPHIPIKANGLENGYETISTSYWKPYAWSINNVAFAEVTHMSLAYWQAGRNEEAYKLFKSNILDGMYLGDSPGNCGQISFYDAARGERYRDFGDPVGMYSRALIQGLYGILPDMMNKRLVIRPGFPNEWDNASLSTSDIDFSFNRNGDTDSYQINSYFKNDSIIELLIKAQKESIKSLKVNGKENNWELVENVDYPLIKIECKKEDALHVQIQWKGNPLAVSSYKSLTQKGEKWQLNSANKIEEIKDPQHIVTNLNVDGNKLEGTIAGIPGNRTLFVKQKQDDMEWWEAVEVEVKAEAEVEVEVEVEKAETLNIEKFFNASVTDIFKPQYHSPRSPYTTLQIPIQGIGEWCHPKNTAEINDSGFRASLKDNVLETPFGVPFQSVADTGVNNIVFTSLWDNYPEKVEIPLQGKASHVYLLMAGSTNHMQYGIVNGTVTITYTDGTNETLELINPDTWLPIEQDLYIDGYAFKMDTPRPWRVAFKTGVVSRDMEKVMNIPADEAYGRKIDGGAGIFLDMPLNPEKELKSLELKTVANEIVIGLMGITLIM